MKTDTLIKQRFEELEKKGTALPVSAKAGYASIGGEPVYEVDPAGFSGWGTSALGLLERVLGKDSIHYEQFHKIFEEGQVAGSYVSIFNQCRAVLQAAREDYEGGYLFTVRGLIRAEASGDVLEQATELLQAGYKGAACVVAGVVLEMTLKELCARKGITPAKLETMNANLCKAGVYNMGMQKQVTAWAERRNRGAHGEWDTFSEADVEDMIRGVTRLVAEYL